jgi:hypothetical protein
MSELVSIIQNASPVLAAAIIGLLFAVKTTRSELAELKKRVEKYDDMGIGVKLAEIQKDILWIREKLEERE